MAEATFTATAPEAKHLKKVWSNTKQKWVTLDAENKATIVESEKPSFENDFTIKSAT